MLDVAANRVNVAVGAHIVAGTSLIPPRLRFQSYEPWMRTLLVLWWLAIVLGAATYWLATS